MIDKSFIEKIESMAETKILDINDRPYSTSQLHPVREPKPATLRIRTLSGLVDYLVSNADGLTLSDLIVHVNSPTDVHLYSRFCGNFAQRSQFLEVEAIDQIFFEFGRYQPLELFNVALQSQFVQGETTASMLKIIGNIKDGEVKSFSDDGISQEVRAKRGVTLVEEVNVPNPVDLAPYRTFPEVEQPSSKFVFRMRSGSLTPECALFVADGNAWALDAIDNIRDWLREKLPKEVTIIA